MSTAARNDAPPADRWLDDCLSVRGGALFIDDCSAEELAHRFGTPLHVISENQLRRNLDRFTAEFGARWPGGLLLLPSLKANPALALRRVLNRAGAGCDVFGPGELEAALGTGTDPDVISLNGPMKGEALLERAVRAGVLVTLDSRDELPRVRAAARRLGRRATVRLRVRPDLAGVEQASEMSPDGLSIRGAVQRYKAGIPTEDLLALPHGLAVDPALDLAGIHFHIGRHSADPAVWAGAIDALAELLGRLRRLWPDWTPRQLDIGGGFPAPRDPFGRRSPVRADAADEAPGLDRYADAICPRLVARLEELDIEPGRVRLELEPGRALYADAGIHLATVRNLKRQTEPEELAWIETDTSDSYLPDVNLELNRWTCLPARLPLDPPTLRADVTGRTCALDVVVADAALPPLDVGDVLVFLDTGAYQDATASNFNALGRPGTVLVSGDEAELIRRHETVEDVFARDLIPARLLDEKSEPSGEGWRVIGIDHASITCADLDRSLNFYCELLGLDLRARGEDEGAEFEVSGISDPKVRWADLLLPGGHVLELIEYVRPRGRPVRPDPNDPGATHISLRVADADAAHRRLRDARVLVRGEPMTIESAGAWRGARVFYCADPDGVTIEVIQPAPVSS
ncbi:MAG TPA: VOC family protein [Solirubrobacterales bacterium]|nr:VOC family protein [Solirubrobacterales bacterium]